VITFSNINTNNAISWGQGAGNLCDLRKKCHEVLKVTMASVVVFVDHVSNKQLKP